MRNYRLWTWEWVIVLIILIFLLFKFFPGDWFSGTEKIKVDNTAALKVDSIKKALDNALIEKSKTDADLKACLDRQAAEKQAAIDKANAARDRALANLLKNKNDKKAGTGKPQEVVVRIIGDLTGGKAKVETGAGTQKLAVTVDPEKDATYLSNLSSVDKKSVVLEDREMKFCIRTHTKNGFRWEPYEAVYTRGKKFTELVDNGVGGVDLAIRPSQTLATIVPTKPFITTDGYCGVPENTPLLTAEELRGDADFFNLFGVWVPWQRQNINGVWCRIAEYAPGKN